MTIEKKLLGTSPSGGATDVADVFSTDVYTGNSTARSINNGIDLAGEGGLVWQKLRVHPSPPDGQDHYLRDTVRGGGNRIYSNKTNAQYDDGGMSFNSNGFAIGGGTAGNLNGAKYVSWTFRKKEKFFTCLTYSGNGVSGREIAHGLGGPVGMMIVKRTNASDNWFVYHRSNTAAPETDYLALNETQATADYSPIWNDTAPTNTVFTVGNYAGVNASGGTYVAYLFADNSSEDAEDQMIKCGGFTGNATVNLGWEPQFVLYKRTDSADNWMILDNMRGWEAYRPNHAMKPLRPNLDNAEYNTTNYHYPTSTGIQFSSLGGSETYIYMAIRAPMMVEPKAATDVFAVAAQTGASGSTPRWVSGFVTDMTIQIEAASSNHTVGTRMLGGNVIYTDATNAASGGGGKYTWDYMTGFGGGAGANAANKELMWKRAKGHMDCVTWKGNATARTIPHSLGVAPEMIWVKNRDATEEWFVYAASEGINKWLYLSNVNDAQSGIATLAWNNTIPSATVLSLGTHNFTNDNNKNLIAYLFATLAGISKVGSYTGNGSYQTIPCGFSAGSRFILIKRTDTNGDWYVWDSLNGIVAGNSPHSSLNTSAAQVTNDDSIDPANAGFIVNQVAATNINVSGGTYIFYAIA